MPVPLSQQRSRQRAQKQLDRALALHRQGKLGEAERLYRKVLEEDPRHFDALHHLGVLKCQQGNNEEGTRMISAALQVNPGSADALLNLGLGLEKLNRLAEALAALDRAVATRPQHVQALFQRSLIAVKLGRPADGVAGFDQVLAIEPRHVEAQISRGVALGMLGRDTDALAAFDAALALAPAHAHALAYRAVALVRLERYAQALASCEAALARNPNQPETWSNRATALGKLGRCEEAVASCDRALKLRPHFPEALVTRGTNLSRLLRHEEAVASYDQALAINPNDALALYNRGNALGALNRREEAIASYDAALRIKPDYPEALYNRGNQLRMAEMLPEAIASYERALALRPDHPYAFGNLAHCELGLCNWQKLPWLVGELDARIRSGRSVVSPFVALAFSSDPAVQRACAAAFVRDQVKCEELPADGRQAPQVDKLRIGYLSADYRAHPVGGLIAELIERHDRSRFEIIGISFGPDDGSDTRTRLKAAFDQFHDVRSADDLAVARLVRELGIHIAVDLTGHTENARPQILAYRAAPIQVNYLGYSGSSGAPYMDYVIGDPIVLPFDQQPFFSEQIVQLPDTFLVNDSRKPISPHVPRRAEMGLPDDALVLCCFNNSYKLTPALFDIWMRLLGKFPGSVVWLSAANDLAVRNLRREAQERGIDPARLVFAPRLPRTEDHLARQRLADLFLDTLPYNAHTTASEALWTGLPVITCKGSTFAGRVGASLLQAVGLPELVTGSLEEYEVLANRLAGDRAALDAVRRKLTHARASSPLFDTERFRRHIEHAYMTMWDIGRSGSPPRGFSVPPAG